MNRGLLWPPNNNNQEELSDEEFFSWFSGFVDAEGSFMIYLDKKRPNSHSFRFELQLHSDDSFVLHYIQKRLGFGIIYVKSKSVMLSVTKLTDIKSLIQIFEKYPLWTYKQLDFKDFKYVFSLREKYFNNYNLDVILTKEMISHFFVDTYEKVVVIKNGMNKKRNDFSNYDKPNYKNLDPYWLVGFVEGDGGFWISRDKAVFSITQKNDIILNAIRDYIIKIIGKKKLKLKYDSELQLFDPDISSSSVYFHERKTGESYYVLPYNNQDTLYQYIAPFFAEKRLLTRKSFDFYIWLICLHLIIYGYQKLPQGKVLLLKLRHNMNNARYLSNHDFFSSFFTKASF
jgi:hypothetical protein